MSDQVAMVISLTGCGELEAKHALEKTGYNTVDAVEFILDLNKAFPALPPRKKPTLDPIQQHLAEVRKVLENFDKERSTSAGQHGYAGQVELTTRHEETALQNNCSQQCQLPSLE